MVKPRTDLSFLKSEEADYFYQSADYAEPSGRSLSESVIERISRANRDPAWLRDLRYAAFVAIHQRCVAA